MFRPRFSEFRDWLRSKFRALPMLRPIFIWFTIAIVAGAISFSCKALDRPGPMEMAARVTLIAAMALLLYAVAILMFNYDGRRNRSPYLVPGTTIVHGFVVLAYSQNDWYDNFAKTSVALELIIGSGLMLLGAWGLARHITTRVPALIMAGIYLGLGVLIWISMIWVHDETARIAIARVGAVLIIGTISGMLVGFSALTIGTATFTRRYSLPVTTIVHGALVLLYSMLDAVQPLLQGSGGHETGTGIGLMVVGLIWSRYLREQGS